MDVLELFGGVSGVGTFCVRRRLARGENTDLVTGLDLTKDEHQTEVLIHYGVQTLDHNDGSAVHRVRSLISF